MPIDPDAPIIPGESAAGIMLGSRIDSILQETAVAFVTEVIENVYVLRSPTLMRYRSDMVDLWVEDGVVNQVMVHDHYRGKALECFGLGSRIAEIEELVGRPVEEDDEDNLVIAGIPGLRFEIKVEGFFHDIQDPAVRHAPITGICVFSPPIDA